MPVYGSGFPKLSGKSETPFDRAVAFQVWGRKFEYARPSIDTRL